MLTDDKEPNEHSITRVKPPGPPAIRHDHDRPLRGGLSAHILPASATMIGACLTALYISLLGPRGDLRTVIDKLLAVDALVFLVSALLSFLSMRSRRMGLRYETRAELIFVAGLGLLALGAVVLAFAIT